MVHFLSILSTPHRSPRHLRPRSFSPPSSSSGENFPPKYRNKYTDTPQHEFETKSSENPKICKSLSFFDHDCWRNSAFFGQNHLFLFIASFWGNKVTPYRWSKQKGPDRISNQKKTCFCDVFGADIKKSVFFLTSASNEEPTGPDLSRKFHLKRFSHQSPFNQFAHLLVILAWKISMSCSLIPW